MAGRLLAALLTLVLASPITAAAQARDNVWSEFIARVDIGTEMDVHLINGQHFRATLIGVRDDAVLMQPKTRITVPVQAIPYDAIVKMERRNGNSMNAGKAALIGIASGAATFMAIIAIVFATVED